MSAAFQQRDGRQTVSACVIVKNEAHNLVPCLTPLRRLVNDMVVIDTGSTDGSADIARQFGARWHGIRSTRANAIPPVTKTRYQARSASRCPSCWRSTLDLER